MFLERALDQQRENSDGGAAIEDGSGRELDGEKVSRNCGKMQIKKEELEGKAQKIEKSVMRLFNEGNRAAEISEAQQYSIICSRSAFILMPEEGES